MADTEFVQDAGLFENGIPAELPDHRPGAYDVDYISDISMKMQIPDKISMDGLEDPRLRLDLQPSHMMVPDRIILAGDEQHIGLKGGIKSAAFNTVAHTGDGDNLAYVGLITPPRTLTMEERFPVVEETEHFVQHQAPVYKPDVNGMAPIPYTPGISPNDMVLLNEEDEATLLRTQVAKLTRRLTVMEADNQRRASREVFLYPAVFGYFLVKILWWFLKTR